MRLIDRFSSRALPDATYTGASNAAVVLAQSYGANDAERILPTFQSYAGEGYHANGVVFSVILARLNLFCEAEFKFRDLATKRLFGTPALEKLEHPWPGGTTGELLARMEQDVSLAGNAFIVDRGDRLQRLRPDWVDIIRVKAVGYNGSDVSEVAGYMHFPEGRAVDHHEFLTVDEVAHWSPIPDPLAEWRGMSWLTPVVREINSDLSMTAYKRSFFDNNATPNALIKYVGKLEKGAYEQVLTRWNARHGGPEGWKTAILDQGADLQVIGNSFEAMDFTNVQAAGENRIASAGGVPAIVVGLKEGLDAASWSMYTQAMRRFTDMTMRPNWRSACAALSKLVEVPDGARLWYDTSDIAALREGEKERAETMQVLASSASTLLIAGYEADSITAALTASDLTLLKHTGLISVQLVKAEAVAETKAALDTAAVPADAPAPKRSEELVAIEALTSRMDDRPAPAPSSVNLTFADGAIQAHTTIADGAIRSHTTVEPAQVRADVHVPEALPPVVQVDNHVAAPEVRVDVAAAPAPSVTVNPTISVELPNRKTVTEVVRDKNGLITKTTSKETDA